MATASGLDVLAAIAGVKQDEGLDRPLEGSSHHHDEDPRLVSRGRGAKVMDSHSTRGRRTPVSTSPASLLILSLLTLESYSELAV